MLTVFQKNPEKIFFLPFFSFFSNSDPAGWELKDHTHHDPVIWSRNDESKLQLSFWTLRVKHSFPFFLFFSSLFFSFFFPPFFFPIRTPRDGSSPMMGAPRSALQQCRFSKSRPKPGKRNTENWKYTFFLVTDDQLGSSAGASQVPHEYKNIPPKKFWTRMSNREKSIVPPTHVRKGRGKRTKPPSGSRKVSQPKISLILRSQKINK